MARHTSNYNLFLPDPDDQIDVLVDLDNNFATIDATLNSLHSTINSVSIGGATVGAQLLKEWTESESYETLTVTYDITYTTVPKTATIKWPDQSGGLLTVDTINANFYAVDGYHITHALSALTVTQPSVTRNSSGLITIKPALTVA